MLGRADAIAQGARQGDVGDGAEGVELASGTEHARRVVRDAVRIRDRERMRLVDAGQVRLDEHGECALRLDPSRAREMFAKRVDEPSRA